MSHPVSVGDMVTVLASEARAAAASRYELAPEVVRVRLAWEADDDGDWWHASLEWAEGYRADTSYWTGKGRTAEHALRDLLAQL